MTRRVLGLNTNIECLTFVICQKKTFWTISTFCLPLCSEEESGYGIMQTLKGCDQILCGSLCSWLCAACPLIVSSNNMLSPPRDRLQHKNMPPSAAFPAKKMRRNQFFFCHFCILYLMGHLSDLYGREGHLCRISDGAWLPPNSVTQLQLGEPLKSHNFQFQSKGPLT